MDYAKLIAKQDELIAKRKGALGKKRAGAGEEGGAVKTGVLDERELKKLLKQAQRRKAKLVRDQKRRTAPKKGAKE
jgi:hypothetical protein